MFGTSVLKSASGARSFEVVSSIRTPSDVRHQDPLGPDHRRCRHRAHDRMGGDAMDGMATGLPTATRSAVVRALARRSGLSAAGFLLVVVRLRCLCAAHFYRGGLYRGIGW